MKTISEIRKDFPLLNNLSLAYLDNSATSQKPQCVLDAEKAYYEQDNANPFRGLYDLSIRATDAYEHARVTVRDFIHASSEKEVIFTRNTSESMNLVAFSLSELLLEPGDEVLVSVSEHHSNMLPWRMACQRAGATLKYIDVDLTGEISPDKVASLLTPKTKIMSIAQVSNIFGRENDIKAFAGLCHANGTALVVDGAQSVPHMPVDVQELDVDFLAFSGHKMLGPMAIGVLYGKEEWLQKMPPYMTGGEMISYVKMDGQIYAELPHKFEAGTVNAAGAVGLEAAIHYIQNLGFDAIQERETALTVRMIEGAKKIPHVVILGSEDPTDHHGIMTFQIEGVHPHDVSAIFADHNIAVRAGHHCAQPLHIALGIPSTTRASVMFYNTEEEVDKFLDVLASVRKVMGFDE